MHHILQKLLANKARRFLQKYHPIVIGVTGSVGKTSTRHAIAAVLSAKYSVVTSRENYNNEFGLPFSILGVKSPGKNPWGWLKILCLTPKPAQVYVLEYGIDHPGDMDYLLSIAKPSIAVMTTLSPVHVEFFTSIKELGEEKAKLLAAADRLVVLNVDDAHVIGLGSHAHAPIVTYGFGESADVHATDYSISTRSDFSFSAGGRLPAGRQGSAFGGQQGEQFSDIQFKVSSPLAKGGVSEGSVSLKNRLGKSVVSSVLAGIVIAKELGLTWDEILSKLDSIPQEPGRINPIPGIKGSLILDSTYNAAPASMFASLGVLSEFEPVEGSKRIAVLGHMAELGNQTEAEHRLIGMRTAEVVDALITVGEMARGIQHGAKEAGLAEEQMEHFATPEEAGRWLDQHIKKGDIVLVKGSQSARMEKVVKDVMAEPARAEELLVRQTGKWLES